jgi:hypothetical protein
VAPPSFAFALLKRLHAAIRIDGSSLIDGAMSMGMMWSTVASGPSRGLPQEAHVQWSLMSISMRTRCQSDP